MSFNYTNMIEAARAMNNTPTNYTFKHITENVQIINQNWWLLIVFFAIIAVIIWWTE